MLQIKGLLHCGGCGSRMLLDFATNPRGVTYAYFVCSGRASKKTGCTRRAVPVAVADLVADSYASITISDQTYRNLAKRVAAAFDKRMAGRDQEVADLMANRAKLEAESDKFLAAHFADAVDLPHSSGTKTVSGQASPTSSNASPSTTNSMQAGGRSCTTACGC